MHNEVQVYPNVKITNNQFNPTLESEDSEFILPFYQTKETLMDVELYRNFLRNAISVFRRSRTYKAYKSFLHDHGFDHCQVHSNIDVNMATIEMHHNILNIHDIAFMITEHIINTIGYISSFDLIYLLKKEHLENNVPVVMLSVTPHEVNHAEPLFFLHPKMSIQNYVTFIDRYKYGISVSIANKLRYFFEKASREEGSNTSECLLIRDQIVNWSNVLSNNVIV